MSIAGVAGAVVAWLLPITQFISWYFIYLDVGAAVLVLGMVLFHRPRIEVARWFVRAAITLLAGLLLAIAGTIVLYMPPPGHPSAGFNSFPSHHALVAAQVVALVWFARRSWAVPFGALAILIDIALILSASHWPVDVLGGTVFALAGAWLAARLAPRLDPYLAGPIRNLVHSLEISLFGRDPRRQRGDLQGRLDAIERRQEQIAMQLDRLIEAVEELRRERVRG